MGKKKKGKKKKTTMEEFSLLENIDKDIISQYSSIKEDIERFQYQLMLADKKTRKKYKKAMRTGKRFDLYDCDSVKTRKKIIKEMEQENFLTRIIKICEDFSPVLKLLGRCLALLLVAVLSFDSVKLRVNGETLTKMDKLFNMVMSI